MLGNLKKTWRTFRTAESGTRFKKLHETRSDRSAPVVYYSVGALLLVGGVVLLFIPGPGLLLIAFGAGLIARQSLWVARRLDRLERTLRKGARKTRTLWNRLSMAVRAALVAAVAMGAAGAGYAGYLWLLAD